MRKISLWLLIFALVAFTASRARAQEDATQQQIDKLSGQIQDLQDALATQGKRITALEKEINDLSSKASQPGAAASPDDLKNLAEQVQEIDKKRQDDNARILKELERLEKALGASPSVHKTTPSTATTPTSGAAASGPQKGYDYKIQAKDTLSAIARAYSAQGIKVTVDQILKANPGLDPKSLIVGKTIFIPDPSAK